MGWWKTLFGGDQKEREPVSKCDRCGKPVPKDKLMGPITVQNKTMRLCAPCMGRTSLEAVYGGKGEKLRWG